MTSHGFKNHFPSEVHGLKSFVSSGARKASEFVYTLWLFTESDTPTFVLPNSLFGIFGALASSCMTDYAFLTTWDIMQRIPLVLLFNWSNLLIFDLSNQRSPDSVIEDQTNKPWRPLPAGRISIDQARLLTILSIPIVLAANSIMGVEKETMVLFILTWLYNDLKGGDGLGRNAIISVAFAFYNLGSLRLAAGTDAVVSAQGLVWIAFVSGVILTTMQVQDLKDQEGDAKRGRRTLPLVLGDGPSRWMLAGFITLWSILCANFWELKMQYWLILNAFGAYIAVSIVTKRNFKADARSWRLWCAWTAVLYACPLLHVTT